MLPQVHKLNEVPEQDDSTITTEPDDPKRMRSRIGKKTEYDFAILREVDLTDMVKQHRRYMHKMEARGPYMY